MSQTNFLSKAAILSVLLGAFSIGILAATEQELLLWNTAIILFVAFLYWLYHQFFLRWGKFPRPRFYEVLLFLALFSGPPRFRSRDPMASLRGEIDLVVLIHIVIWMLGAAWVAYWILLDLLYHRPFRLHKLEIVALLFAISLALSILISQSPHLTAFRVGQIFVMIFFAYYWTRRFGIDVSLRSLLLGFTVLCVAIMASLLFKPDLVLVPYGPEGFRLRGDYIANAGAVGLLGIILLTAYPMNLSKSYYIPVSVGFSAILLASRTRSAYAGFLIFLLLVLFRSPRLRSLNIMKILIWLSIPIMVFFHEFVFEFIIRERHSLSTLSDRTRIWAGLASYVLSNSPLLGIGFYTERTVTLLSNPGVGTAHGSFAAVFAGAGLLGLVTFIALLTSLFIIAVGHYIKNAKSSAAFAIISLILVIQPIGITSEEMVIASPTSLTFFMTISLLARLKDSI